MPILIASLAIEQMWLESVPKRGDKLETWTTSSEVDVLLVKFTSLDKFNLTKHKTDVVTNHMLSFSSNIKGIVSVAVDKKESQHHILIY